MATLLQNFAVGATALGVIASGLLVYAPKFQAPAIPNEQQEAIQEVSDPLQKWLLRLAAGENCSPQGTMDSGSLSYGRYCYKEGTFKMFVRKLGLLPHVEDAELMNWIGDPAFQDILTRAVLEDSRENWVHWRNTTKRIGLPPSP